MNKKGVGRYAVLLVARGKGASFFRLLSFIGRPHLFFGQHKPVFFKSGGTGAGKGFSWVPDLTRFAFFTVWESDVDYNNWLKDLLSRDAFKGCKNVWWIGLTPLSSSGMWDSQEPFFFEGRSLSSEGKIAVLTRASVRWNKLHRFWKFVPLVEKALVKGMPGLELSIGFGELPWIRQATLSVWESASAMKAFAYASPSHKEVIYRTREEGWYSEELFARFLPGEVHEIEVRAKKGG